MSDGVHTTDADIIRDAYAEKVREAFKVFAENLGMGQNEKSCCERFLRTMSLVRKARDMALEAAGDGTAASDEPAPVPRAAVTAEASAAAAAEGLSEDDRAIIEQALSGTTGRRRI